MNEAEPSALTTLEFLLWAGGSLGVLLLLGGSILKLIAKNGWAKVAKQFPALRPIEGRRFRSCSGMFGAASYSNSIHAIVGPSGIYLYSPWLFSYGHAPLLLPWHLVQDMSVHKVLWVKSMELKLEAAGVSITLTLPASAKELLRHAKDVPLIGS